MTKTLEHPQEIGVRSWNALYSQVKGYKEHSVFKFSGFSKNHICDYHIDAQTVYENALSEILEIGLDTDDIRILKNCARISQSGSSIPDLRAVIEKLEKLQDIL